MRLHKTQYASEQSATSVGWILTIRVDGKELNPAIKLSEGHYMDTALGGPRAAPIDAPGPRLAAAPKAGAAPTDALGP